MSQDRKLGNWTAGKNMASSFCMCSAQGIASRKFEANQHRIILCVCSVHPTPAAHLACPVHPCSHHPLSPRRLFGPMGPVGPVSKRSGMCSECSGWDTNILLILLVKLLKPAHVFAARSDDIGLPRCISHHLPSPQRSDNGKARCTSEE